MYIISNLNFLKLICAHSIYHVYKISQFVIIAECKLDFPIFISHWVHTKSTIVTTTKFTTQVYWKNNISNLVCAQWIYKFPIWTFLFCTHCINNFLSVHTKSLCTLNLQISHLDFLIIAVCAHWINNISRLDFLKVFPANQIYNFPFLKILAISAAILILQKILSHNYISKLECKVKGESGLKN